MNKKQKEKITTILISIIGILIATIFIMSLVRLAVINPEISYSDVCKEVYGENWRYELTNNFGRTCIELDYVTLKITNRTPYNWTFIEIIEKYCNPPRYFDLERWDNGCLI